MTKEGGIPSSLPSLADALVVDTKKLLKTARSEEDLRIGFEKLLEPIKNKCFGSAGIGVPAFFLS